MKTTRFTLLVIASALTASLAAEEPNNPPINPALLYWQAAAELPPLKAGQAEDLKAIATGRHPFDPKIVQALPSSEIALYLLRKAAASPAACDWGLDLKEGPALNLPHISKLQEMASFAIVKAESLFAEGKTKEGLEWLLTTHRLARHAGAGDLLVSNLVQFLIETNAIHAAARHCLGWDETTRQAYAALLKTLPPLHTTQDAYRGERVFIDWTERRLLASGEERRQMEETLKAMIEPDNVLGKDALAPLAPDKVQAALVDWRALQTRTEAALGQPWPQANAELKALAEESTRSPYVLIRSNYAEPVKVANTQFAVATLRTMLDAALEHGLQLDEAAATTYRDAFEGEPLRVQKNADGTLTLLAARQHPAGKDLSLPLGK